MFLRNDLFSIVSVIFVLLIYYHLFMIGPLSAITEFGRADNAPPLSPLSLSFDFDDYSGTFYVFNKQWQVPLPTNEFIWKNGRVVERDVCFNRGKVYIRAEGKEIDKYVRQHRKVHRGKLIGSQQPLSYWQHYFHDLFLGTERIFYFQCENDMIKRLFYCPEETIFDGNTCVHEDVCENKRDGFKYAHYEIESYYECEDGKSIKKHCPKRQVFDTIECTPPLDPCKLLTDGEIWSHTLDSYNVCRGGTTHLIHCLENEYYNPLKKKCCSRICMGKEDGKHENNVTIEGNGLSYSPSFVVCKDGEDMGLMFCKKKIKLDTDQDLPLPVQVFDPIVKDCYMPRFCRNVFLMDGSSGGGSSGSGQKKMMPGSKYRRNMKNYVHSILFDHMYGYFCEDNKPVKVDLAPNEILNENYEKEEVCQKEDDKIPILNKFNYYFDCKDKREVACSVPDTWFDFSEQKCKKMLDCHHFESLPVFKFDNLKRNWFKPRKHVVVGAQTSSLCDSSTEKWINYYNVCAEQGCENYPFLKQLKDKSIMIDDEYECRVHEGKIKRMRYRKRRENWLKLDFWRQTLISADKVTQPCTRSEPLQSDDFMLNKILYPTCEENTFVLCPSSDTIGLDYDNKICIPDPKLFTVSIPAKTKRVFYLGEVGEIHSNESNFVFRIYPVKDGPSLRKIDIKNVNSFKLEDYLDLNKLPKEFQLHATVDIVVKIKYLPTNHPDYFFINEKLEQSKYDYEKDRERNDNETVEIENYHDFEYVLKDFT